jgi:hypothetical protein
MPRGTEAKHAQTEVQWWQNKPQCSHRALTFQSSQKGIATMKDADRKKYVQKTNFYPSVYVHNQF